MWVFVVNLEEVSLEGLVCRSTLTEWKVPEGFRKT